MQWTSGGVATARTWSQTAPQGAYLNPASLHFGGATLTSYAIIETGGKQYRVVVGETVRIEKLDVAEGDKVVLDNVLALNLDGTLTVGAPFISGAKVTAKVRDQGKAKKIIVFKYHNKTNYRKKTGHRQPFTAVTIESIEG
jgi:large subunit ribosomal protein L21